MPTLGEAVIRQLEAMAVDTVFGIPGVHNAEFYRGLADSPIRHVTPRHEQGAGFMADGYARVTGKPGVCLITTGPGITNIATAMGQAYGDSIPMLVLSSVNALNQLGRGEGHLHELPSQRGLTSHLTAFSHTVLEAEELPLVLSRALAVFSSARPRPVHIEIPFDLLEQEAKPLAPPLAPPPKPAPSPDDIAAAAKLLAAARAPVLLVGGGAADCGKLIETFAARLDAPVVMTVNGKGLMPPGSALSVGFSPAMPAVQALLRASDVVLAVGTEIGPTDFDATSTDPITLGETLIRIDIDPGQASRSVIADLAICSDAGTALTELIAALGSVPATSVGGKARAAETRKAAEAELSPAARTHRRILDVIRSSATDVVVVGDSTMPIYSGNRFYEAQAPRSWFNAATGYGTLGYALPAAIGASLGAPGRPIVCLAGDGGLQFTLPELATAIDVGRPLAVVLWNNNAYGAIRRHMEGTNMAPIGVGLSNPDFLALARAYGCAAVRPETLDEFASALVGAYATKGPTLIEIVDPGPLVS